MSIKRRTWNKNSKKAWETRKKRYGKSGMKNPEERNRKISESHKGKKNSFFGKHHTEESKQKIREALKDNKYGLGYKHTKKAKEKIRKAKSIPLSKKSKAQQEQFQNFKETGLEAARKILSLPISQQSKARQEQVKKCQEASKRVIVSQPQKELFYILKMYFYGAKLEYPIRTKKGWRFADIGIPFLKWDIEYDGAYWHKHRKESDKQRDLELAEVGWTTFRVSYKLLKKLSKQGIKMLNGMAVIRNV